MLANCINLEEVMNVNRLNRRQFLQDSAKAAGGVLLGSHAALARRDRRDNCQADRRGSSHARTDWHQIEPLGMGTGSNSGQVQFELGREAFNDLVHYAYDQGITYFDSAQTYKTFDWLAGAIKGLPREKLFIQSKVPGQPEDVSKAIDHHRKVFNTDYIDSMLVHCMIKDGWTDQWKRIMDGFDSAKEKGWIRSKGVSCHSLPALRTATATPWAQVHLVGLIRRATESMAKRNPSGTTTFMMSRPWSLSSKPCEQRARELSA